MATINLLLLVILGSITPPVYADQGIGTVFSSNDVYNPNPVTACTGKKLIDSDLVIAHRTLKCGEEVIVCTKRNLKCAKARVIDRGPYGIRGSDYTSILDMSIGLQKKIEHNGFEEVFLFSPSEIKKIRPKKNDSKNRRIS